jgi:plasmid stabilization system protein ParE
MDYRIILTEEALADFTMILGYIAEDDEDAASRFGEALLDHVYLLERFPRMGTPVPGRPAIRKLVHAPILVYYRVIADQDVVEILHFLHGARKPR